MADKINKEDAMVLNAQMKTDEQNQLAVIKNNTGSKSKGKSIDKLEDSVKSFIETLTELNDPIKDVNKSIEQSGKIADKTEKSFDKLGDSVENSGIKAKEASDFIIDLAKSFDKFAKSTKSTTTSLENIEDVQKNFSDGIRKINENINDLSSNIDKISKKFDSSNKKIESNSDITGNSMLKNANKSSNKNPAMLGKSINDMFKVHVIEHFENNIIKTGNVLRTRITELFYGIYNHINGLYADSKNQLDLYKAKGGFFPVPIPISVGSGNSNEGKFDKKTGDLSESYVLKKTETGVAVNWLYKKLHSEKRIGSSSGGFLSSITDFLSEFWEFLSFPFLLGFGKIKSLLVSAVEGIFSLPGKIITGATNILKSNVVRYGAGLMGAAYAVKNAVDGFNNADEWFNKNRDKLDMSEKVSATIGGLVGGMESGLEGALKNGAKWAAIGNMVAPGIGAIVGGVIGSVTGYIGGENIAKFLKNLWDQTKLAFTSLASDVAVTWDKVVNYASEKMQGFKNIIESAVTFFATAWENAINTVKNIYKGITELFGEVKDIYTNDTYKQTKEDKGWLGTSYTKDKVDPDSISVQAKIEKDKIEAEKKVLADLEQWDNSIPKYDPIKTTPYSITNTDGQPLTFDNIDKELNKPASPEETKRMNDLLDSINGTAKGNDTTQSQQIKVEESPEAKRNRENTNKMAERALEQGSIFTHDIHIEKLFKKEIKQNDDLMKQQDELNEMIKADQMLDTDSRVMEAQGYVPRRDASGQTIRTPTGQALTRALDMTESEKQQSKMSTKQQIQSDSKLPAEFQKKLEDNVSTRGGANLAGLTPEMKARLANAAAEYKQKTGKDFDVTSGYRSGTKQADIMMEKWNQGIGKQWYGHTFEKLGLAKNGKLNVSEEDAKKKLAEYYDKNKIGHASGEKIDVGKENLQMKMELLQKHGIKSTNIKGDEIDFIMDKKYKNVLDPNATPGEYEKKMSEQSNQPINNDEALKNMVKRHEGSRNKAYKDTEGYWTVGVGHKLGSDPALANTEWSNEQVDSAFTKDLSNAQDKASKIPEYANLNKARQNALTDMTFNMGQKGVMNFKNMRSALASGDYEGAANELLNSKYAKQTGGRAKEIAEIIRSGKMPGEVESEKSSSKSDELAGLEKQKEVEKSQLQAKQTAEATLKAQKDQKPVDKQDTKSVSAETMGGVPMNTDGIPAWIMSYHFENEGSTSIFKG